MASSRSVNSRREIPEEPRGIIGAAHLTVRQTAAFLPAGSRRHSLVKCFINDDDRQRI
jgi:hypothetical protein